MDHLPFQLNFNLRNEYDELLALPILKELLAGGPIHIVQSPLRQGRWDMPRLLEDLRSRVISRRAPTASQLAESKGPRFFSQPTVIRWEAGYFVILDGTDIEVLCNDWQAGEKLMDDLTRRYWSKAPRPRNKPVFSVIKIGNHGVETHEVAVQRNFTSKEEELNLYYGSCFKENFHDPLVHKMKTRQNGVVVLRGAPGTGKTTYIRTMMWTLRKKHRFVTVPLLEFQKMTSSECTHFWLERFSLDSKKTGVLVIEDAEALIRSDGEGRSPQLSTLLNLGDGLLGEHLKLHFVLSVNCPIDEIDPALTRRGRLLGYHEFTMRTRTEALAIADKHNLVLPDEDVDELSLSDIFAEAEPRTVIKKKSRPMGFAPSPIDEDVPF